MANFGDETPKPGYTTRAPLASTRLAIVSDSAPDAPTSTIGAANGSLRAPVPVTGVPGAHRSPLTQASQAFKLAGSLARALNQSRNGLATSFCPAWVASETQSRSGSWTPSTPGTKGLSPNSGIRYCVRSF